ncbi:MAG: SHOCT domain-containing protein [Sporichthyaceae bacterium]
MEFQGYNGTVHVTDTTLTIVRDGAIARSLFGKDSADRAIPLSCVAGVHCLPATMLVNGFLQLHLAGVDPVKLSTHEAGRFPDAVLFTYKRRKDFEELHTWLWGVVERNHDEGLLTETPAELLQAHRAAAARGGRAGDWTETRANAQEKLAAAKSEQAEKSSSMRREYAEKLASVGNVHTSGALFVGESHDHGRNSIVVLHPDRIERTKPKKLTALSSAHQDVEMTPTRSVTSVQATKDGVLNTKVTVYASGNTIEFRFAHQEAAQFKDALQRLILHGPPTPPAPTPAPAFDVADQLTKLADLRDRGILTENEFAAQKAKVLGT